MSTDYCLVVRNSHHRKSSVSYPESRGNYRSGLRAYRKMERRYRQKIELRERTVLRTPRPHFGDMRAPRKTVSETKPWKAVPDPQGRFSTGIPDFDELLKGGFKRGSTSLFTIDETVEVEDLDLLLFPAYLNGLYQSRGIVAVIPARDSPHDFRSRLTRYVTRRRFDSRVRIFDYVGEDQGLSYVVNVCDTEAGPAHPRKDPRANRRALENAVAAERAAQGGRRKPFTEITAFEVFETLMGSENALKMFYQAIKRSRQLGNLGIGILSPGLVCAAGVRRMADAEFALHREEVGLIVRGIRPQFTSHVVVRDPVRGLPHVAFVPQPSEPEVDSGR